MREDILFLLAKVKAGTASAAECGELAVLISSSDDPETISHCNDFLAGNSPLAGLSTDDPAWKAVLGNILRADVPAGAGRPQRRPISVVLWRWRHVAAAILLVAGIGAYLGSLLWNKKEPAAGSLHAGQVGPGREGAILTLEDGSQVQLDTIRNGIVALQGGITAKVVNGVLQYEGKSDKVVYNIMSTPKGRQFQLTLPDGTKVWLNAASSIRYPTVFNGPERNVEITGEAYFEVAGNTTRPFRLLAGKRAAITVLGTHFNVNAYDNEERITTTLLEGAVRVTALTASTDQTVARSVTLRPGQEASMTIAQPVLKLNEHANTAQAVAWKNGLFIFDGLGLREIMRQLERWYDIDVVYEEGVPETTFEGKMTKDISLNDLLDILGRMGIHCRLENRKLIVMP